jgi:aminoglycoside phosphotransferase family enzyme
VSTLPFTFEALLKSQAFPHRPDRVELVQTQMSFIFLTGEYVYKVKKSVNLGYLDYTTLEKRQFFCRQELELNRRLCPVAYLAVVPVVREDGDLRVEGQGEAVEYAVKMRQLPRDRMMDVLLPRGQVTAEMVAMVAQRVVSFHQKAETKEEIAAFGGLDVIRHNCDENFAQTEKYIGLTILWVKYERIKDYTDDFIKSNAPLFEKRVREGRIRDCHGDLHAAHVCFTDDICIYDCIEFNDRFRYCDVASELGFLAMDLDRYGQAALSRRLVDSYVELSHDEGLLKLLDFYKCYRAYVRGKVEGFKLDDALISESEKAKALENARRYFELAESYV